MTDGGRSTGSRKCHVCVGQIDICLVAVKGGKPFDPIVFDACAQCIPRHSVNFNQHMAAQDMINLSLMCGVATH